MSSGETKTVRQRCPDCHKKWLGIARQLNAKILKTDITKCENKKGTLFGNVCIVKLHQLKTNPGNENCSKDMRPTLISL